MTTSSSLKLLVHDLLCSESGYESCCFTELKSISQKIFHASCGDSASPTSASPLSPNIFLWHCTLVQTLQVLYRVSVVKRQQARYFGVLLHFDKLLYMCSAVIFHYVYQKWQVHVISLRMCPTTVKELFRCTATTYLSCSLSSSQNASNGSPTHARTPYALVHTMAAHTAFDYKLVTRGSGCTWSLCHVPLSLFEKRNGPPPPPAPLSPSSAVPN